MIGIWFNKEGQEVTSEKRLTFTLTLTETINHLKATKNAKCIVHNELSNWALLAIEEKRLMISDQ